MTTRRGFIQGLLALAASNIIATTIEQCFNRLILAHSLPLQTIYYDKKFLDTLKTNTLFIEISKEKPLPEYIGKKIQFYNYTLENI